MTIVYDDEFEDPRFEPIRLNGKDGAWEMTFDNDGFDEITFQNSRTVDEWFAAAVEAARKAGISLTQTLGALR